MRAGKLRTLVTVQEAVQTQDSGGAPETTWVTQSTVWGSVMPIRGREALMAGQLLADQDTRIIIRWSPQMASINRRWRVVVKGNPYDIISVINVDEGDRQIELLCKSGLNAG